MSKKLVDKEKLAKLAKELDARTKSEIRYNVSEEAARAQAVETILQEGIDNTRDMFGGKSIRYITQDVYNGLTEAEKNDNTIAYFIIDAEDLSHEHDNKEFLDKLGARTITIGNTGKTFDGSENINWTLNDIGAAASSHSHNDIYYTESEVDTKLSDLQKEIDEDIKSETNRATAAEASLQTMIDGKADKSHGNHVPTIQTANNSIFLRNDNTWAVVTPDDIGAAAKSHGTHVTYSTTVPKENGIASAGSESTVARGDHVHPLQTTITGNAGSADQLSTARNITIGNKTILFDGSENITYTLNDIGAAATSHDHDSKYYTESEMDIKIANLQAEIDGDVEEEADRAKAAEEALQAAINGKAPNGHTHDDRYFTESEINSKIEALQAEIDEDVEVETDRAKAAEAALQAAIDSKPSSGHTHDDRYYTETEINSKLSNKADVDHDHNDVYYTETEIDAKITTLNTAISGKANSSHGNHVPTTQTASNNVFLRNDNTWATITPENIGAAAASHGTHVEYASNAPKANGTASVGSSSKVAREDHIHPTQESVAKLSTARSITIGDSSQTFDGSANITYTLEDIGAATSGHNHDGRYYTESEINTKVSNLQTEIEEAVEEEADRAKAAEAALQAAISGMPGASHTHDDIYYTESEIDTKLSGKANTSHSHDDKYYTETEIDSKISTLNTSISTAKSDAQKYADNKIAALIGTAPEAMNTLQELAGAISDHEDVYDAYVQEVTSKLDGKADAGHTHNYAGSSSAGGAATSANKVNTNLTIKLNSGSTEGTNLFTFNGSSAKTINITPSSIGAAESSHGTHVTYSSTAPKVAGTANVGSESTVARGDHVHAAQTSVTGNAGTATKLEFERNITIGNKTNSFDGSANIIYTLSDIGAAESGHTHKYAGSSSAGGAANSVANSIKVQLNGGTTEGINQFTFNGSAAKTINITASSIGAASASNHGTHVTYSTTTPKVAGTASVGSEGAVARGDHVHPPQTSVTGNAGTATKLASAKTITIGKKGLSFDGSGNITYTLADIGAAPVSHDHQHLLGEDLSNKTISLDTLNLSTGTPKFKVYYCPTDGGGSNITGRPNDSYKTAFNLIVESLRFASTTDYITKQTYTRGGEKIVYIRYCTNGTWTAWEKVYTSAQKPTPSDIGAAASSHGTHVTYASSAPLVAGTAAVGSSSKVAREDHVHPPQTSVSGNAGTATKLKNAKTITIGNKANSFDGSANISYTLADIGAAATGHTHNYAGSSSAGGAANSVKNNLIIKLNGGTTEGTNLFTFNGSAAKTINITASSIGAAGSSHGTHVNYSTTAPKVAGTAAVGSENTVARGDHVHAAQTSVSGNAGTATKLKNAKNITIGNKTNSFDGSANISYTLADIGASPLQKSVVSKSVSSGKLTLSKDRYQKATLTTGNTIVLPSVTDFCEINLFVKDCSLSSVNLPDNCKWRVDPNLSTGTSFIFTFIYTTQEWLAEVKIFS